ncbi:MAG: PAS domain S-box protein [Proteobacteria bacterium]|nr:PAS domain S-box protein [Pseudomonadota bacterium]MBU1717179.1 PAS domain S-box protein [Pseudomonadota bacterium]
MFEYFDRLYDSTDFMPHGDCLVWDPSLLWQHAGSDIVTGIAYYLIAAILFYFILRRRDIPFFWVFLLFGAFILSCGTTHFMSAWTIYYPSYWTEGIIKTINAVISFGTAIILFPLMPRLLSLPSLKKANAEIAELNSKLHEQVQELTIENRKRIAAESRLQESNTLLNAVMEGATDAIFVKDLNGQYVLANTATCRAIGKSHEEIIGRSDLELFPPDSAQVIIGVDLRVMQKGEVVSTEERLATAYGDTTWWLASKSPLLDQNGKITGLIGMSRNITERKKAEIETKNLEIRLSQAQKMEAIGTLAGGIAHDFNNILSVILGYTEMAHEDAPAGTRLKNDLEKVLIAANRAKELVKQILAFSRQAQVERFPLQIQPLIKEGLKMLRSSIPSTISITEDIDPKCGTILADPTQVHQILMNLCTNAYHAMEETGGNLSVSLKTTFIGPDDQSLLSQVKSGEYVEFTVADTGVGIGPDIIERMFEPYFTTKGIGKGTGMGLAIIHGIMKDYGGAVTVESRFGEGTTFHVYFPVVDQEFLPARKESEDIKGGQERILFIDDEELLAEMGKDMLERLGYRVTLRRSSLEALATFQNTPDEFDLVITDQTMPEMTGADLARRMMQIRPDLPIILCTGYSNLIDEDSAKGLGIKEFALKPLTKEVIAKLIRKVLGV